MIRKASDEQFVFKTDFLDGSSLESLDSSTELSVRGSRASYPCALKNRCENYLSSIVTFHVSNFSCKHVSSEGLF